MWECDIGLLYSTFQKLKVRKIGFVNFICSICESKEPLYGQILFCGKICIFKLGKLTKRIS